jgi:N utilization substance protein B
MQNINPVERRDDRISIMEKLFGYDMNNEYIYLNPVDDYSDFVTETVNYVCANLEKIDEVIKASLVNYRINRLSFVDRAIIRMATAEMMLGTAVAVAINEALEIVKVYSDQGDGASVRFVNKVLDNISKNIER